MSTHLLVVHLESGQVVASLLELALFHVLGHIPMDERPFSEHLVKLVVEPVPRLLDGRRVADHADAAEGGRQFTALWSHRRLVVDADLQSDDSTKNL